MKKIKLLLLLLPLILVLGCSPKNEMTCTIESLLLGQMDYPAGSTEDKIMSPLSEEPNRSAARYIYLGKTPAYHVVIEYPSLKRAEERYEDFKLALFRDESTSFEGSSISFNGSIADEMHYGCMQSGKRKVCSFIGRYKNLVTFINIDVDNNGFSVNDFKNSIAFIEEKVSSCYMKVK